MFEELNERRKAVERNIAKSFGTDDDVLELEKALEDEFEKGRAKKTFAIGDTFTRHGITYKCTGISANTGRPTWSKVKNVGSNTKENKSNEELDTSQKQERAKILEFYNKYKDFRNEIETNLGEVDVNEIPFKTLKEEFESWYEDAQYVIKKQQDQSDKKEDKISEEDKENKALSKELDSVSGFKRMTLHGPGYDYFEISKLSSGVYSLRGYKLQSSSPLLRTYSKKEILDKIKELNLKSSGVKTDPSLTNGL